MLQCLTRINRLGNGALNDFDGPLLELKEAGKKDLKKEGFRSFTLDHFVGVRAKLRRGRGGRLTREKEFDCHKKVQTVGFLARGESDLAESVPLGRGSSLCNLGLDFAKDEDHNLTTQRAAVLTCGRAFA